MLCLQANLITVNKHTIRNGLGKIALRKEIYIMDIIKSMKGWTSALTEFGVSLLALGIVLEVLFKGQNIPFWPDVTIITNITGIITALSAEGLVGLVAIWVLYHIYNKK